jgi:hypothetical protein
LPDSEREVGYAALTAVAAMLAERKITKVHFRIGDAELVRDLSKHRDVPAPLVLPYVRLGCALNRFASFVLDAGEDADLDGRARAEVFIDSAA